MELGKAHRILIQLLIIEAPQWSPAFGAGKRRGTPQTVGTAAAPQWSPAFGAGKSSTRRRRPRPEIPPAMEPSFWSWEKAGLLDDTEIEIAIPQWSPAFGAGKRSILAGGVVLFIAPQWSPAFGAGKRR